MINAGLIINPIAGMGGSVGLKGTDGSQRLAQARALGAKASAAARAAEFLHALREVAGAAELNWCTGAKELGADVLAANGSEPHVVYAADAAVTSAEDTRNLAAALLDTPVDLLIFVGGDGTARDVQAVVGEGMAVLGIPAGVKMHSGVFAINPGAAARVVGELLSGQIVSSVLREVRDFDAASGAKDGIQVRTYGELRVPEAGAWVQQTKIGGKESEPLAVEEIVADLRSRALFDRALVIGAGSTCLAYKDALIDGGTLRGVDVRLPDGHWRFDVTERDLLGLNDSRLIVSFSRQQGFLFGRGNQVLSQRYLRTLNWPEDVLIIGTRSKLLSLEGRPLLVDTGDQQLDEVLSGFVEIIGGYEDRLLYRVARDYAEIAHA